MKKLNINFTGNIKKYLIISGAIMLIGIICTAIFGVKMDINFKGGSRITYNYTAKIKDEQKFTDSVKKVADKVLKTSTNVSINQGYTDDSVKFVISASGVVSSKNSTDKNDKDADENTAIQETLTQELKKELKDTDEKNPKIEMAEFNTVEATMAKSFYEKSIVAVILAAVLVIIYMAIRFRKIGGISSASFALLALIHDVLVAFFACVIFGLELDANFMAVVLTIFGYSLNDTIVIYDRIRENRKKNRQMPIAEVTNLSINQTLARTFVTSFTTFMAVVIVAAVAEFFGLTTLRSFAIPMAFGLISGTYSSVCLICPLWVKWQERGERKKAAANAQYAKRAKR